MLKIKLQTRGKKHQRTFRIVLAEARSKADGKFIDDLGSYNPITKEMSLDKDKMKKWIGNGAQLTRGVDKLLNPGKYPKKKKRVKKQVPTEKKVENKSKEKPKDKPEKKIKEKTK